jgi:hypothetical protein
MNSILLGVNLQLGRLLEFHASLALMGFASKVMQIG